MTTTTISATHTTITTPNTAPEVPLISIRQLCLQGFLTQRSRKEIAADIARLHPTSAAAAKSAKHIAWHYGDMKKRGLLDAILKAPEDAAADAAAQQATDEVSDELNEARGTVTIAL